MSSIFTGSFIPLAVYQAKLTLINYNSAALVLPSNFLHLDDLTTVKSMNAKQSGISIKPSDIYGSGLRLRLRFTTPSFIYYCLYLCKRLFFFFSSTGGCFSSFFFLFFFSFAKKK